MANCSFHCSLMRAVNHTCVYFDMKKKWMYFLYLSIGSFFVSSATILLMQRVSFAENAEEWQRTLGGILGALFWLGFIAGFIFQIPITRARKKDESFKGGKGISFFSFFSNNTAIVFDVSLMICALLSFVTFAVPTLSQGLAFMSLFGLVFSIEMHGIFNGKNYEWLNERCRDKRD